MVCPCQDFTVNSTYPQYHGTPEYVSLSSKIGSCRFKKENVFETPSTNFHCEKNILELEKQVNQEAKGNKKLLSLLETFKVSGQEEDGFAIRIGNICRCLWCPRAKDEKDSPELKTTRVTV